VAAQEMVQFTQRFGPAIKYQQPHRKVLLAQRLRRGAQAFGVANIKRGNGGLQIRRQFLR
jgi:hypothetical protein